MTNNLYSSSFEQLPLGKSLTKNSSSISLICFFVLLSISSYSINSYYSFACFL